MIDKSKDNFSCASIKLIHSVKYLGVIIDQFLKWDIHIAITDKIIMSLFFQNR